MDKIVGLKEFRQNVEKYAQSTQDGSSVVVVRRSKPLFRITSLDDSDLWERVIDFTLVKKGGVHIDDVLSRI